MSTCYNFELYLFNDIIRKYWMYIENEEVYDTSN